MPATVERLRTGLLVAAGLLLVVLLGYFFLARRKDRFERHDLPRRLGLNIQQDSNGFTLSRSEHGQTVFTLHAGRAVQRSDGADANLYDVRIVLYGQGASRRQDTIEGKNFVYNPATQLVTSEGAVTIDLQAPGDATGNGAAPAPIHLRTTGLTFDQKTERASTAQLVEFRLPQLSGTAVGAAYDAGRGTVDLLDQVRLHLTLDGGPATLNAANAELVRADWQVHFARAALHTARRDASAADAVLWLRPDGSAQQVKADGDVRMATADGLVVTGPHVLGEFDQDSRIQKMNVDGGVKLLQPAQADGDGREGSAQSVNVEFDGLGKPRSLRMNGSVNLLDNRVGPRGWQRTLRAGTVQVAFANGVASHVTARGQPVFEQRDNTSAGGDKRLKADVLEAALRSGRVMDSLHGTGNTELTQSLAGKETDISTGDSLTAKFAAAGSGADGQIEDAVQQGNVRFERRIAAVKGGAAGDVLVALAHQAEYTQARDVVLLTGDAGSGNPRMTDKSAQQATTELEARQIELYRATGGAVADGAVKATYMSQPGAQPSHVVANHAVMLHSAGTATFTGSSRMWQEGNSVQAPVLVLDQKSQGLTATSDPKSGTVVRTVLVDQSAKPGQKPRQPVRVRSQKLAYSGVTRLARFSTAVTLTGEDGTIRADQADVFFKPNGAAAHSDAPAAMMSGNVDRIVADGDVFFSQPAPRRQGTGQELVYTADDGKFLLTGSAGRRPRIEDAQQGTVSGEALQFSSHEERVDVISSSGRTVTTTRVNK
jgi:lipopolysaccharide export system protein LptA